MCCRDGIASALFTSTQQRVLGLLYGQCQKHYQANGEAPIFDELRRIVVKTIGVVDPVREALGPLAPRITRALVFGSVAKGTDRASSDVDLLVVAHDLTLEELFGALARAEAVLDRKISPTLVGREEFEKASRTPDSFVDRVLRGPTIPVMVGVG